MSTQTLGSSGSAGCVAARSFETICESVRCALLTDAQAAALDSLRADVGRLFAHGLDADAKRTIKVALALIAAGPPALE